MIDRRTLLKAFAGVGAFGSMLGIGKAKEEKIADILVKANNLANKTLGDFESKRETKIETIKGWLCFIDFANEDMQFEKIKINKALGNKPPQSIEVWGSYPEEDLDTSVVGEWVDLCLRNNDWMDGEYHLIHLGWWRITKDKIEWKASLVRGIPLDMKLNDRTEKP